MIAATICSGIGAPEVAMPSWVYSFQSEIEAFPRAVLQQRHGAHDARHARQPGPALWGDFTAIRVRFLRRLGIALPQWLVAGTPCQAFSLAGLRQSLADDRGNLTLEFVRLAHALRRAGSLRGFTWENVPGVLSTKDNAFGCFLAAVVGADAPLRSPLERGRWPDSGMVAGPWARLAWRILDAQYFGLAQRRRRVIVVASFGNGPDPAAVLFERHGMQGNHPPRRQTGEGIAGTLEARSDGGGFPGTDGACSGHDVPTGIELTSAKQPARPAAIAPTLNAHFGDKLGLEDQHINGGAGLFVPGITHSLRAEGCDASEDGTGRGTPLVAVCFSAKDHGADAMDDCSPTLWAGGHSGSHANAGVMPAVAFMENQRSEVRTSEVDNLTVGGGKPGQGYPAAMQGSAVRRLTPRECERLQGFADDFTLIRYRGKPAADGPRYKALGNSMAVPVMRWVGQRIDAVDAAALAEAKAVAA